MKTHTSPRWPWIMLVARLVLFIGIQALFALGFLMAGFPNAWKTSANWWPFVVTITNFISVQLAMTSSFKIPSNCWITPNQWEAKQSCANTELFVHSPDPIHLTRF